MADVNLFERVLAVATVRMAETDSEGWKPKPNTLIRSPAPSRFDLKNETMRELFRLCDWNIGIVAKHAGVAWAIADLWASGVVPVGAQAGRVAMAVERLREFAKGNEEQE